MKVFYHHMYEYRKGLRNMILHTLSAEHRNWVEERLRKANIAYQIYPLKKGNINVFFGASECVDVVRAIGKAQLNDYTPEEDFILGTMLGYDRLIQCRRYLELVQKKNRLSLDKKSQTPVKESQENTLTRC